MKAKRKDTNDNKKLGKKVFDRFTLESFCVRWS